jgi:predicted AAA+ superfamily ATPase
MSFKRPIYQKVMNRLHEKRKFIQVLSGPRQVGKTSLIRQVLQNLHVPFHYASADSPTIEDFHWINQQWEIARTICKQTSPMQEVILVLDEIQKVPDWSDAVKTLWDEDTFSDLPLKVVLLGSSPLLIQQGLNESLAGRFELIPITHWSYIEMRDAFDWSLDQYIYFGGYPGAADHIHDEDRFKDYVLHSLIETTISRDILLMVRVDKPALLRRLFHLGAMYSGQILSYHKMLGQLHDAGNATTLAHYLDLLAGAGMLMGIPKYTGNMIRQKASSPKFQILNTALISAQNNYYFEEAKKDTQYWGRLVESAVGALLANRCRETNDELYYWRERNKEVDFVFCSRHQTFAIEVKSGIKKDAVPGLSEFSKIADSCKPLLLGGNGMSLFDFFTMPNIL